MGKSDYPKVLRRGVAGMVILLLLFGAFAPAAMAPTWPKCDWYQNCEWWATSQNVCNAGDITVTRGCPTNKL